MPMASSTTVRCGNTAGFTGLVYRLIASSSCGGRRRAAAAPGIPGPRALSPRPLLSPRSPLPA